MKSKLVRPAAQLSYEGAALALDAALAEARRMGVPQNIAVVDAGGNLLAFARMDGARFHARHSAIAKAGTAASLGEPTGGLPPQYGADLALATGGRMINLVGGLPIVVDGQLVGAIGVSSSTDEDDLAVARAGLQALLDALA